MTRRSRSGEAADGPAGGLPRSAALAAAVYPIIGNTLRPVEGLPVTELFAGGADRLLLAGSIAAYTGAGLLLAAARLRWHLPGLSGAVAGAAGRLSR